jgi:hypothetical protein
LADHSVRLLSAPQAVSKLHSYEEAALKMGKAMGNLLFRRKMTLQIT